MSRFVSQPSRTRIAHLEALKPPALTRGLRSLPYLEASAALGILCNGAPLSELYMLSQGTRSSKHAYFYIKQFKALNVHLAVQTHLRIITLCERAIHCLSRAIQQEGCKAL